MRLHIQFLCPLRTRAEWLLVEFMVKDGITDPIMQTDPIQWSPLSPLAYYDTPAHSVLVAWFRQLYNIFALCNLSSAYMHVFSTYTVVPVQIIADVKVTTGERSDYRHTQRLSLTHAHSHYFPRGHLLTSCHRVRASW